MKFDEIPIIILAGGKSSRMERGDKALLPFGGYNSLAEFQYKRLKASFKNVYISSKNNKFDFEANLILDNYETFAPTIAIKSIFENLKIDKIFLLSVDTPFVKIETIKELLAFNSEIVVARSDKGVEPLCGVYSNLVIKTIDKMLENNNHKLNYLIKNSKNLEITFDNENEFLNMNEETQYELALKMVELWREKVSKTH